MGEPSELIALRRSLFEEKVRLVAQRRECETVLEYLRTTGEASSRERRDQYVSQFAEIRKATNRVDRAIVACQMLSKSPGGREWVCALQEVLGNLLAIEQFAVYRTGEGELVRVAYSGTEAPPPALTCAHETNCDPLNGRIVLNEPCGYAGCGVGCVPFKNADGVEAVLIICSLLPQKPRLSDEDKFVLDVMHQVAVPPLDGCSQEASPCN